MENQQWCSVGGASRFCGVVFFGVTVTIYLRVYTYTQMTHTHTLIIYICEIVFCPLIRVSSPRQWLQALRGKPGRLLLGHWDAFGYVAYVVAMYLYVISHLFGH